MFAEPPSPEMIDEMYAETMKTPTSVATTIVSDLVNSDLRNGLSEIDVPTLLLYGDQSKVYPSDVGAWIQSQIPEAELVTFADSGHYPFREELEKFNEAVRDFVR